MLSLPNTSSPSSMPVFDVHPNHQDRLGRSQGNACATSRLAAGSIPSLPSPSTSPPSLDNIYSFDYWTSLLNLNSDISYDLHSGYHLGLPVSDPSFSYGSQDSVSSSPISSTPPSSMASPLGDESVLYFTPPHDSSSAFNASGVGGQDLVVPALPLQGYNTAWPPTTDISHSIPSMQHLHSLTSLSGELVTADAPSIPNQSLQGAVANNLSAMHGNFITSPIFAETTALGLFYPDTTQSPDVLLLSTQAENNASVPYAVNGTPPPSLPTQNWTFRAVNPAVRVSRSKLIESDETRTSDHVITTAAPRTTSRRTTSHGTKVEPVVECTQCGYLQLTKRMGDFRRHLKKHEAEHLSRFICCGVPLTHPAAANVRPEHPAYLYEKNPFYGGCGKSYSRMDALQRHLKKSGCLGGSARDHQSWRKLYFRDRTGRRAHRSAQSSVSSDSQNSPVPSPM